jgi:hypothetical protein
MTTIPTTTNWEGENGMKQIIKNNAGLMKGPYTGAGINYKKKEETSILRSVDDTDYYADNLDDPNNVEYTLFGHNGDQDEREPRFNEPLLNQEKTKHIYLYRVRPKSKEKYMFYGKYTISGRVVKSNRGKDGIMRNVIVLQLTKIND